MPPKACTPSLRSSPRFPLKGQTGIAAVILRTACPTCTVHNPPATCGGLRSAMPTSVGITRLITSHNIIFRSGTLSRSLHSLLCTSQFAASQADAQYKRCSLPPQSDSRLACLTHRSYIDHDSFYFAALFSSNLRKMVGCTASMRRVSLDASPSCARSHRAGKARPWLAILFLSSLGYLSRGVNEQQHSYILLMAAACMHATAAPQATGALLHV